MSENDKPQILLITCPHVKLKDDGSVGRERIVNWRYTDVKTFQLTDEHILALCESCADIVTGSLLAQLFRDAVSNSLKSFR